MNIISVNYNRTYAIGPFLNEKIGVEATIEDGDNPIEVLKSLKELADNFNKIANPHLGESQPPEPIVLPTAQIEKPIGKSMVEQIMSCGSIKVLESYKLLVKNNPEWQSAYDLRFEQLKQIEIKDIMDKTDALITQPQTIKLKNNSQRKKYNNK
jgi:hypothetical protein